MSESGSTMRVRLGTIANSLIERHNRSVATALDREITELQTKIEEQQDAIDATPTPLAASEISGALSQKIIDLVTSMDHCLSDIIDRVLKQAKHTSVSFVVIAKELRLIRYAYASKAPKDQPDRISKVWMKRRIKICKNQV